MEDLWNFFLTLSALLFLAVCYYWLVGSAVRCSDLTRLKRSGSTSDNSRRAHSGLLGDQGDRQQRKRRIKRRTLNL
jgi:hypothetical protein